ncbi:M56 family metallopeptidase, partial [Vagococcus acidifermentans]
KIVYCNNIQSPMVTGILKKYILLPDLNYTDQQMRHIIIHELQHIKNFDIYIELLLEILVITYWWFPPIYLLKRQVELITEMRVDKQVMDLLDPNEYMDYIETLIFVKRAVLTTEDDFYPDNIVHLPLVKKIKTC